MGHHWLAADDVHGERPGHGAEAEGSRGSPALLLRVPRPRRAPSRSLPAGLSAFTPPLLEISVPRNFSCTFLPVWGGGGRARPRSARQSPSLGGGSVRQKPHTAFCLNCPFSGPGLCSPAPDAQQHPPRPPPVLGWGLSVLWHLVAL